MFSAVRYAILLDFHVLHSNRCVLTTALHLLSTATELSAEVASFHSCTVQSLIEVFQFNFRYLRFLVGCFSAFAIIAEDWISAVGTVFLVHTCCFGDTKFVGLNHYEFDCGNVELLIVFLFPLLFKTDET